MKRLALIISLSFFSVLSYANHITGGEMFYTYLGQSGGLYQYRVTLWLYRDHFSTGAALDASAAIGVFDKVNGAMIWNGTIPITDTIHLHLSSPSPCISNPPVVWYEVGRYSFTISLPGSPNGYIIGYQRCCRIAGINNLSNSVSVGTSYTAEIPANNLLSTAPENNSAIFVGSDTVIVCAGNQFNYSFAASDADGDQLSYTFCDAFAGASAGNAMPNPPAGPPYFTVPYAAPYNGSSPMGSAVTLDPATGLISGIAPPSGIYVVTVCVAEKRNGILIATQRKDLQIKVGDCTVAKALLNPQYITCDGFTLSFQNLSSSPLINSFFWDFGVTTATNDTSIIATPTFTFPDTGVYHLKLVTNRHQQCSDSTTAIVKVYPGFFPNFTSTGVCVTSPIQFTDNTSTVYGIVNSWSWNFGDAATQADSSHSQNPAWTYAAPGIKNVQLIVTNSKGCVDTALKTLTVIDKPVITLPFNDTLICAPDALTLGASGTGVFSWTPLVNIINPNTPNPTVNPSTTTWYYVNLDDSGCKNKDSVQVRVINGVSLFANNDTTICLTDGVMLGANTDGLQFQWTPSATLDNPNILNPIATPTAPVTVYQLKATVGSCSAVDNMTVRTIPYPTANAGPDQVICYNTSTQLNGSMIGSSFSWSPANYLSSTAILNPTSSPPRTTKYILSVLDVLGCPKPGRDSVTITVLPKIKPFAGRDTSVIVGQPLHFNASGGTGYIWSPPTGLNNTTIPDPIGIYGPEVDSVRYKLLVTNQAGCVDSAFVLVVVFKSDPHIFVPSAFIPNNDGLNDYIYPIAVGIQKINFFSIYNRWGQLLFTTTENGRGWDGKVGGTLQGTGVFVWMVGAEDFLGKKIFEKGTVTLIR